MKNKIISISLVCSLLFSNANAIIFEQSSSTSASEWKDPASGITYNNFGSVSFKFKKSVTSFAPWVKARPPALNAGCAGISFDAGFASFLDLETIGKQLEQAISSIGMGVIVVLMQTMPSIAKAFEDIQKLIRKLQSMLANACQNTVALLNDIPAVKEAKDSATSWLSENSGADYFNETMEGAVKEVEGWEEMLKCEVNDKNCNDNAAKSAISNASSASNEPKSKREVKAVPSALANTITSKYSINDAISVKTDSLENVLKNDKFDGKTLGFDTNERQYIALRIAMFGTPAVPYADGAFQTTGLDKTTGKMSTDPAAIAELAKTMTSGDVAKPSYKLKYYSSINDIEEIVNFFTGEGLTGTNTNTIKIPTSFNYTLLLNSEKSSRDGGVANGSLITTLYLETAKGGYDSSNSYEIAWAGIQNASYLTILNAIDSSTYSAPSVPVGVYMPKGNEYVTMIKAFSEKKDYQTYADLLSKINVKYALSDFIRSAKNAAKLSVNAGQHDTVAMGAYIAAIDNIEKRILEKLKDYSGDVIYLNNLDQIFNNMKQATLQKRMKRMNGQ